MQSHRYSKIIQITIGPKLSYQVNSVSIAPTTNGRHSYSSHGRYDGKSQKVEELKIEIWRTLDEFLFVEKFVKSYLMVTFKDALYVYLS